MLHAYLIHQSGGTFGQTGAGCHSFTGDESVVASCPLGPVDRTQRSLDIWNAQARRFMEAARPVIVVRVKEPYPHDVSVPIERSLSGFERMINVIRNRGPADPFVATSEGVQAIRICEPDDLTLGKGSVSMDPENLAYQREMLRGRA